MERSPTSETRVLRLFGDVEEETKGEASDRSPLETEDADDETEEADDGATPRVDEEGGEDDGVRDNDAVGDVDAVDAAGAVDAVDAAGAAGAVDAVGDVDDGVDDAARDASERVRFGASIAQLYRLKNDEYVPVGPAGLAILDRDGAEARDVLIYSPDKQPLVRRAIDERLTCEPQRDNYVTISHDGVILFSALMRNESDWLAVAAQITIGHFVAARKRSSCESETPTRFTLDVAGRASSEASISVVEMGDSVQVNFESIQGGLSTGDDDVLSVALRDDTSRRTDGVKAKLEDGDASALPSGLMEGLLGLRKDGRRLILHPRSETEFTLYDVTVLRMKKASKEAPTDDERSDAPRQTRAKDEVERASATFSESDERNRQNDQCSPSENTAMNGAASAPSSGTPPPPRWYVNNQSVVTAPMVPLDQSLMLDVKRAVDSLTEEMATLADKSRVGGAWIPPPPRGETKRAVEALTKARREAMLPRIDVDAMSLADINQLTVEAERVAEMHEELRDYRRAKKSAPSETSSTPVEATDTDA